MELALSLGDHPSKPFSFLDKTPKLSSKDLGFCMGFKSQDRVDAANIDGDEKRVSLDPPLQLDLLPFTPVPRNLPWLLSMADEAEEGASLSSPNSAASSFQMDFGFKNGSKRGSDDDENGSTRKKLRLSKEQSAFLEESFKEHNTLNPKQKLALAKQLNLRPRQIEVWFQNRRARTKLKQTEVDCEYLKRSCETLAEENKRLQKELLELRALKTSQPFYMQLPATTLTMCPSCERVATTASTTTTTTSASVSAVVACGGNNNDVKTEGYQFFSSSTNT